MGLDLDTGPAAALGEVDVDPVPGWHLILVDAGPVAPCTEQLWVGQHKGFESNVLGRLSGTPATRRPAARRRLSRLRHRIQPDRIKHELPSGAIVEDAAVLPVDQCRLLHLAERAKPGPAGAYPLGREPKLAASLADHDARQVWGLVSRRPVPRRVLDPLRDDVQRPAEAGIAKPFRGVLANPVPELLVAGAWRGWALDCHQSNQESPMAKSVDQIRAQIAKLQEQEKALLQKEAKGVIARIKEAVAHYGITPDQIFGSKNSNRLAGTQALKARGEKAVGTSKTAAPAESGRRKGIKAAVKFKDDAGNTWSGRGSQPRWLRAAIEGGKKLEDFIVA